MIKTVIIPAFLFIAISVFHEAPTWCAPTESDNSEIEVDENGTARSKYSVEKQGVVITVLESKIFNVIIGGNKPGIRLKIKNTSPRTITYLSIVIYFIDNQNKRFHEESIEIIYPKSKYSIFSHRESLKHNYSMFYPENSSSVKTFNKLDAGEWQIGEVEIEIKTLKFK